MFRKSLKKTLFLFALVLVSVTSINETFAVEYKDNTGYTPKWAKTMNQDEVLNFCGLVPTPSQDADWCKEFGVYVNQQFNLQQIQSLSLSGECVGTKMYGTILENGKDSNLDGGIKIINEIGSTVDTIGLKNGKFILVNYSHYSKIRVYHDESQNVILDLKCNPKEVSNENQQFNPQQPTSLTGIPIVGNQISDKVQQDTDLITLYYTLDGIFTPEQNSGMVNLIIKGKVSPTLFQDHNSIQSQSKYFRRNFQSSIDYQGRLFCYSIPKINFGGNIQNSSRV